jgi:hypothetical protein
MSEANPASIDETDSKYSALIDDRVRRARTEEMTVTLLRRGGIYEIQSSSGRIYEVDIVTEDCTCPDAQNDKTPDPCKHVHRVKFELEAERVPRPDGRLPTAPPSEQTKPLGDRRGGGNRSLLADFSTVKTESRRLNQNSTRFSLFTMYSTHSLQTRSSNSRPRWVMSTAPQVNCSLFGHR